MDYTLMKLDDFVPEDRGVLRKLNSRLTFIKCLNLCIRDKRIEYERPNLLKVAVCLQKVHDRYNGYNVTIKILGYTL